MAPVGSHHLRGDLNAWSVRWWTSWVAERSSAIVMEGLDQRQTGRGLLVVDGMIVEVDRNAVVAEEDNKSFVRMDQDRQMFVNRKDLAIVVRMMNPENRP